MTVRVVTDSAASLPTTLATELGVHIVPMHLVVAGREATDGEVPLTDVAGKPNVTTAAPSPGEFLQAIECAGDESVVITIASKMSATYKSALIASELAEHRVLVVDSETAAGAQGLVVMAAAKAAQTGASADEVEEVARKVAARVSLVAAVDGLDSLVRSGRIPGLAGRAGNVLGVQPLFAFRGGKVKKLRPSSGRDHALDRLAHELVKTQPADAAVLHLAVLHALADDDAKALGERVCSVIQPATCFVGEFSSVMVAHTGPGLVGLAWWWEQDG